MIYYELWLEQHHFHFDLPLTSFLLYNNTFIDSFNRKNSKNHYLKKKYYIHNIFPILSQ